MKWLHCAWLAAALCFGGGAARADTLALPTGEKLPFGQNVTVWQGKDSYFAGKVAAVLGDPSLPQAMAKDLLQLGVYEPSEAKEASGTAEAAAELLRASRAYQVRSIDGDTMYAMYVLSFPSIDMPKGTVSAKKGDTASRAEERSPDQGGGRAGTSKGGVGWRLWWTHLEPVISGYAIPLWFCTVETVKKAGAVPTVTILVTDQVSGKYFTPLLEKALEEAQ